MSDFNPSGVGIKNGNIFGFPYTKEEADLVIMPIPWDATASYTKGTSKGPQAILDASVQLDFYHPFCADAWKSKLYMEPISKEIETLNAACCEKTIPYIKFLEEGGDINSSPQFKKVLDEVDQHQNTLKNTIKTNALEYIKQGKIPAVLGGEHSTPLGLMEAMSEHYGSFGILQIDAHADLRDSYEGFTQSHASIMFNALKLPNLVRLTQVGIRDICQDEIDIINDSEVISTFFDWQMKSAIYDGTSTWGKIVDNIIKSLPQNVYISFDIDGLKPYLCPNTGTPVPGGLEFEEAAYLLRKLVESGKKIIGFDLNEVAPGNDEWNANVGARVLWYLSVYALKSNGKL
jgi:agmatinase